MTDKIDLAMVELIRCERFYAELLMRMKKVPDRKVKSLKINITAEGVILNYNPDFMNQFALNENHMKDGIGETASILKNQCEHILRGHLKWRRQQVDPDIYKDNKVDPNQSLFDYVKKEDPTRLVNIAEDMEINETIPNLPKNFFVFDEDGKPVLDDSNQPVVCQPCKVKTLQDEKPNKKILNNQTMEYYYSYLKEQKQKQPDNEQGKSGGKPTMLPFGGDASEGDGNDNGLDDELKKQIVKAMANDAYEALPGQDKGRLPAHLVKLLESLNEKSKDWRKELRQFRESCMAIIVEETRKRRNRRYGTIYPGRRYKPKMHLIIAKDSSGSVCDEALTQFDTEISAMAKLGIKITVIDCDSSIQQVYEYKDKFKKATLGRGGTSFEPVFTLVKTKEFIKQWGKPDGLIYFTDGEDWGNVVKPKFRVLWALLPNCQSRYEWGSKCWIDIKQKKRRV